MPILLRHQADSRGKTVEDDIVGVFVVVTWQEHIKPGLLVCSPHDLLLFAGRYTPHGVYRHLSLLIRLDDYGSGWAGNTAPAAETVGVGFIRTITDGNHVVSPLGIRFLLMKACPSGITVSHI